MLNRCSTPEWCSTSSVLRCWSCWGSSPGRRRIAPGCRMRRTCSMSSTGSCMAAWRRSATGRICYRIICWPWALSMAGSWRGWMLMGAALMRSGWLKGRFSLRHYRRTGALLVVAGMAVKSAGNIRPVVSGLGLSLVCVFAAGAARTERPVAGNRLCLAGLGLLAAAVPFPAGGRYRLRRTHGAEQLPAADPDLHHPVLSSRAVYALRSPAAAGLCSPHLGR